MTTSKIEWTDRSDWNPIRGCTRVSPGCGGPGPHGGCYAEAMAARFSKPGQWGHGFAEMRDGKPRWTGKVALAEDRLLLPLRWRKPAKVFVSSTSDVFHEALPDEVIDRIFAVMALCPHLTFQILTKRPERMRTYLADGRQGAVARACVDIMIEGRTKPGENWPVQSIGDIDHPSDLAMKSWPLPNVWLGTSVEDQPRARERIPYLLDTPAAVRFLSCEPLLGPLDLTGLISTDGATITGALQGYVAHNAGPDQDGRVMWEDDEGCAKIDWVIAGGESGPRARAMHPDWARSVRDQCQAAGVPFFFKQWGEWVPRLGRGAEIIAASHGAAWPDGTVGEGHRDTNGGCAIHIDRIGKKDAGRQLDGREWNDLPEVVG